MTTQTANERRRRAKATGLLVFALLYAALGASGCWLAWVATHDLEWVDIFSAVWWIPSGLAAWWAKWHVEQHYLRR